MESVWWSLTIKNAMFCYDIYFELYKFWKKEVLTLLAHNLIFGMFLWKKSIT